MSYVQGYLSSYVGSYLGAPVVELGAYATSMHSIHVDLSATPRADDAFGDGDALNPLTWAAQIASPGDLTVIAVRQLDASTFVLITLEPLGNHLEMHQVTANGMIDVTGDPYAPVTPAVFAGAVQTMDPVDAVTGDLFRDRDLANPPFQIDRQLGFAGTLMFGADGDYQTDAGAPLVKKLVLRRLGTRKDSFRHLRGYGIGLIEKEPIPSGGSLVDIRKDIENQAQQEPDVEAARARLSIDRAGVLVVLIALKVRGGMTINMRMGSRNGRLVEI